jgi:hypothetical protein
MRTEAVPLLVPCVYALMVSYLFIRAMESTNSSKATVKIRLEDFRPTESSARLRPFISVDCLLVGRVAGSSKQRVRHGKLYIDEDGLVPTPLVGAFRLPH